MLIKEISEERIKYDVMFYEVIDDITADAGIRVKGESLEELFCKAILATFNEMTDIERVERREVREVGTESPMPFLLADLLNEVLVLHERDKFVASGCEVLELGKDKVRVNLSGERFDPERHTSKLVIKAATYYRLRIDKEDDRWVAEVIFDI